MSDCEDFGVALEQRLRAALPDAEAGPLDAHLATCPDCRDYLSRARRVEAELGARVAEPIRSRGWLELRVRLRAHRRMRLGVWFMALLFLGAGALAGLGFIGEQEERLAMVVLAPALAATFGWLAVREGREVRSATKAPGGLFAWARRNARVERWAALGAGCWFLVTAVASGVLAFGHGDAPREAWAVMALLSLVFAVLSLRMFVRLRRELEALS